MTGNVLESANIVFYGKSFVDEIPHAMRIFICRACHNTLATKANLFRRKVTKNPLCSLCEADLETMGNVLWGCSKAKVV